MSRGRVISVTAECVGVPVDRGKSIVLGAPVGPAPRERGMITISIPASVRFGRSGGDGDGDGDDDDNDSVLEGHEIAAFCSLVRILLGTLLILSGLIYVVVSITMHPHRASDDGSSSSSSSSGEWASMVALLGILVGVFICISGSTGLSASTRQITSRRDQLNIQRRIRHREQFSV